MVIHACRLPLSWSCPGPVRPGPWPGPASLGSRATKPCPSHGCQCQVGSWLTSPILWNRKDKFLWPNLQEQRTASQSPNSSQIPAPAPSAFPSLTHHSSRGAAQPQSSCYYGDSPGPPCLPVSCPPLPNSPTSVPPLPTSPLGFPVPPLPTTPSPHPSSCLQSPVAPQPQDRHSLRPAAWCRTEAAGPPPTSSCSPEAQPGALYQACPHCSVSSWILNPTSLDSQRDRHPLRGCQQPCYPVKKERRAPALGRGSGTQALSMCPSSVEAPWPRLPA
uniref:Uncharacterized protein n=1 Tax=Molossus molossus TaxID=27622 RepID=A0A7J8BKB8_MOLMO|nr:hypothetical protein HJG59_010227 [Molossus molossus]